MKRAKMIILLVALLMLSGFVRGAVAQEERKLTPGAGAKKSLTVTLVRWPYT